jgi:putative heme iron utilization protein
MVAARLRKEPNMALSDTQLVVLSAACQRPNRSVYPLAAKLPGGAAAKVLGSLLKKGFIKEVQAKRADTVWREHRTRGRLTLRATPTAFEALGIDPAEAPVEGEGEAEEPAAEADTSARETRKKGKAKEKASRTRANSKQAKLVEMLKRRDGATIEEIVKAFDWQAHTVRGAIAGALKKKLGLSVVSEKIEGRGRVYRIEA